MSTSELRPDLRLVPTDSVRFHEHPERARTLRIRERIERDGVLKNPPVVADMGDGGYLLLDGANRVSAFADLGYSHVPVQVVDYGDPAVELRGWHHLLLEASALDLREIYGSFEEVRVEEISRSGLGRLLELRQVFAVLAQDECTCAALWPRDDSAEVEIRERIRVLEAVVGAYEGQSRLERIKLADYEQLPAVVEHVDHQVCLYPALRKEELLHLAAEGVMIPTGLTRHVIPGRALGLDLELSFLRGSGSDVRKVEHFRAHVDRLAMTGRIRFYAESVFVMNE